MESIKSSQRAEKAQSIDWRALAKNVDRINPELQSLMDRLVESITEDEIEEKYKEILAIQEKGNENMRTNIPPREGLKISAIIDVGMAQGLISAEEGRNLMFKIHH